MRANGIEERYCTGEASPYEKFLAWASTVPKTLRNPLYHWTHLELKRYFGIDDLLDETTAPSIWNRTREMLASEELCTTDDPTDDLAAHRKIAASGLVTKVFPAFRPDRALGVDRPESFNAWVDRLAAASNIDISSFHRFLDAIRQRHDYFHRMGSRLSDHGLNTCFSDLCPESAAAAIFDKVRGGRPAGPDEHRLFASFMMFVFGRLDAEKGWTKQLHLGARRNVNTRRFRELGPDTGFDSIGDWPQIDALAAYLDRLEQENALPRMILYNLNPADNYAFATLAGCFQDSAVAGKIQFGSGWWHLDQNALVPFLPAA